MELRRVFKFLGRALKRQESKRRERNAKSKERREQNRKNRSTSPLKEQKEKSPSRKATCDAGVGRSPTGNHSSLCGTPEKRQCELMVPITDSRGKPMAQI